MLFLLSGSLGQKALAQAPGLVWSTNVGAQVFAVDAQTNVYADAGTNVLVLNASGVPLKTNAICPAPGLAQRDNAGNLYFAGTFTGTNDFGGTVLTAGAPGYYKSYLAKYNSAGALQWAVAFGSSSPHNAHLLYDLLVEPGGGCYASFERGTTGMVAHFDISGTEQWATQVDGFISSYSIAISLGGLTSSNCCVFVYGRSPSKLALSGRIDAQGNFSRFSNGSSRLFWGATTYGKPVIDDHVQEFLAATCWQGSCNGHAVLRKLPLSGTEVWDDDIGPVEQWTMAGDAQGSVYLGGANGSLVKYASDGRFIWSNNFGHVCIGMIVDAAGNRFVSFEDGTIARLQSDPSQQVPAILSGPQPATVFVGDNATLSITASGTPPLRYQWKQDGTNVPNGTAAALNLTSVTASQSGSYSVVVTNAADSVTSAPALLKVKSVQIYRGSQMLSNVTYNFTSPPTLSVRSAFTNGSAFYTLDGSAPTFASTYVSGPFTVPHSATVRAIGYSADFHQSQEADTVNVIVPVRHTLTVSASGGGSVNLNPPGGTYTSANVVSATAVSSSGYSFLHWLGDVSGTSSPATVSMESDKTIRAVFGTTLSTTVAGNGQVFVAPLGGLYPYGTTVRLTAVPQAGNYFGTWGNAASGNANPLYFAVTNPALTISSIFGATPAGQAALTLTINGNGRVNSNPRANLCTAGQSVTLTATADSGQSFLGWSGDASGLQNPLTISMTQSKVILANFSARPLLSATRPGLEVPSPDGSRLTLISEPQTAWCLLVSTNLNLWRTLGTVTNSKRDVHFTDLGAVTNPTSLSRAAPRP